jgi:hypothetical protein
MDVVVPNYYQKFEETYGMPMCAVHRVDLHNQLRELATQKEGLGFPVDVQVRLGAPQSRYSLITPLQHHKVFLMLLQSTFLMGKR